MLTYPKSRYSCYNNLNSWQTPSVTQQNFINLDYSVPNAVEYYSAGDTFEVITNNLQSQDIKYTWLLTPQIQSSFYSQSSISSWCTLSSSSYIIRLSGITQFVYISNGSYSGAINLSSSIIVTSNFKCIPKYYSYFLNFVSSNPSSSCTQT
jgi:hypothetical protein